MTATIDRSKFSRCVLAPADELFVHASRVFNDDEPVTPGDLASLRAMTAAVGLGIDGLDPTLPSPGPAPAAAPVDLLDRLVAAGIAATTTDHAVTISQAANTIEAYRKREFAEHVIATDAARDARENPLAAGLAAVVEARAAGLKEGMTFRAAVQQCMRTSGNALRPVGWPRGYCFTLSGATGRLTAPGLGGGPATISADEILGGWEVLPHAEVQREAADRAADGVEVR